MSKTLSKNMPSLVTSAPETSQNIAANNGAIEDTVVPSLTQAVEVKKIVLLKRPTTIQTNGFQHGAGASNSAVACDLIQTPDRSGASSPIIEGEITAEESADFGEIDLATGLDGFLLAALKNQKDRLFLLKLDQDMERFIKDKNRTRLEFPPMNSYQRLIVHRVAQYFKLSHVVDTSGKAVVLYKSAETAIPILRFSDLLEQEEEKPEKSVKIMRRQPHPSSLRSGGENSDSNSENERKQYLTIEEREAAYQKARARIFKDLEKKNSENEQEETEGSRSSSPSIKNSSNSNNSNSNDQPQNNDPSANNNKAKGNNQQSKGGNANTNNKNPKQGQQQPSKSFPNNKNPNNKNTNAKNRQQQPTKSQTLNYNLVGDRSPYVIQKQGRLVNAFPGSTMMQPILHPGPFNASFFGPPFDVNPGCIQQPMITPEMQVAPQIPSPYMNISHEWTVSMGGHFVRPSSRNPWAPENFNGPTEVGGNLPPFNQQLNNQGSFLPSRPPTQNDTNFSSSQVQNSLKQYQQSNYHPSNGQNFNEANQFVNSSIDGNTNKSSSLRDSTTSPTSPLVQPIVDNNPQSSTLWSNKNGQWNQMSSGEGINENKVNERSQDQKRMNNRSSAPFIAQPQRDNLFQFNPVWNNNSDPPVVGVFNPQQSGPDFPLQNGPIPQIPHMQPHVYPIPPIPSIMGPRRPIPAEYMNIPRVNMVPHMMGFPPQISNSGAIYDVEKRPPKSTELFDPNNPQTSSSQSNPLVNSPPSLPSPTVSVPSIPATSSGVLTPSTPLSAPVVSPTNNTWLGGPMGNKVTNLPQNPNNLNPRRKHATDPMSSNNPVLDGTAMRSLSLSSVNSNSQPSRPHQNRQSTSSHSNQQNRAASSASSQQNRTSSISPSGNNRKKETGLLFDYRMQTPYEGVKPSEANEPPQPNHILELYDFAETDDMSGISLPNATIKHLHNSPNKGSTTIIAIFKTSREANKALNENNKSAHARGVRFKLKTWELLGKNNGNNVGAVNPPKPSESNSSTSITVQTNNQEGYEKQPLAAASRNPSQSVKKQ